MKKALLLFLFCANAFAGQDIPQPPHVDARSYVVLDLASGQTIASRGADERIAPASLTKLMTAYLVFDALKQKKIKPDEKLKVSDKALHAEGSKMFLNPGKSATVKELVRGMIIEGGNDAAVALAEGVAGSEKDFVDMMNKEAQRLGMSNTHFTNSTGLPESEHYSTARDIALLSASLIIDFPDQYPVFSAKEYTWNGITQPNRNRLLWMDPYADGLMTGHSEDSGYCLAASVRRDRRRLISVLAGAHSDSGRAIESEKLLNYALQYYVAVRLYTKGQTVTTLRVWKGKKNMLKAGFLSDLYVTVPRGEEAGLKAVVEAQQPLVVPVLAGQQVGTLKVSLDGKRFADYPIVSLENVSPANLIGRAWDSLKLLLNGKP